MLDEITLYWLTNTAGSSARVYLEQAKLLGTRNNPGRVDLPVAVSTFPNDLPAARSWAEEVYPNLYSWRDLDRGSHFAALEVPELFTEECGEASGGSANSDQHRGDQNAKTHFGNRPGMPPGICE
jgi:epoxide hydrolase